MRVLEARFTTDTNACRRESTGYVLALTACHNGERVKVLTRARDGRMIEIWCRRSKLGEFREVEVPERNPLYGVLREKALKVAA